MADPKLVEKLDAVFNAHMDAELAGDLDKTLATMSPNPHLVNIPTMVGAKGRAAYGRFMPSDLSVNSSRPTSNSRRSRAPTAKSA